MKYYLAIAFLWVSSNIYAVPLKLRASGNAFQSRSKNDRWTNKVLLVLEAKQLERVAQKNKKVFVMITARPTKGDPYYEIQVGYKDSSGYDTKYIFRVKKTFINQPDIDPYLEVVDLKKGAYVPLVVYRKYHQKS